MEDLNIIFSPEFPIWILATISGAIALLCLFGLFKKIRGSFIRTIAGALLVTALFNPSLLQEDRSPLKTIIPLVID